MVHLVRDRATHPDSVYGKSAFAYGLWSEMLTTGSGGRGTPSFKCCLGYECVDLDDSVDSMFIVSGGKV
jgi:hypothetical protein